MPHERMIVVRSVSSMAVSSMTLMPSDASGRRSPIPQILSAAARRRMRR